MLTQKRLPNAPYPTVLAAVAAVSSAGRIAGDRNGAAYNALQIPRRSRGSRCPERLDVPAPHSDVDLRW